MKKLLSLLLCIVMVCALCSVSVAESNMAGQKIVIWEHTPQFEAPLKAVIEGFSAKYPEVEVEYQIKTSDQYYNLLATAVQAGEAPDLFWTNGTATSNLESYVSQNKVMDLTDKLDASLFTEKMMGLVTVDGKVYASPTVEVGGRAVYYNKDIFADLGISVPKNFAEFEAILPIIKEAGIVPIAFSGMDPWAVLFHFEPVLAALATDWLLESEQGIVNINDDRVAATYNKILEWADAGYYGKGYTGVDEAGALLAFSKGDAAMCIEGTWNTLTIQQNNPDLNLGAFHVPTADGRYPFVGTTSVGFSVSNDTKAPEASLAFVNYFASQEAQTAWCNTLNAIPGVAAITSKDPVINEIAQYDLQVESFYTILGNQTLEGENPRKVWEEDQTLVCSKGITVKEFLDTLASMCVGK